MSVQSVWGIAAAQWRLFWRSPGAWSAALLLMLWAAYTFYCDTALWSPVLATGFAFDPAQFQHLVPWIMPDNSGVVAPGFLALLLCLIWTVEAWRSQRHATDELIGTSAMPASLRIAGELTGSLLVGLALMLLFYAGDLAAVAIRGGVRPLGVNLSILALLAVPAVFAWLTITRLAATWLPPAVGYLLLFLPVLAGARTSELARFASIPGPGDHGMMLTASAQVAFAPVVTYRLLLLPLGFLLGLLACLPRQKGEGFDPRALGAWALVTALALLLSLPGAIILLTA